MAWRHRTAPSIVGIGAPLAVGVFLLVVGSSLIAPVSVGVPIKQVPASTDSGRDVPAVPRPSASPGPNPFSMGMPASLVIGQDNFTSARTGHGPANLSLPDYDAAFNSAGDLWVVDMGNNRVLAYVPPFSTGMSASLALGQSTLSGFAANTTTSGLWEPAGIAIDAHGDVWVADSTNNRILEFAPPFHTGMNASTVLGQSSFTTNRAGTTATNLSHPRGLAFNAAGDLFVADSVNNRILEFRPPFSTGMAASLVFGQTGFTTSGAATSASGLSAPGDVALGPKGALWVADSGNRRVVAYSSPFAVGMNASLVLGQYNLNLTNETLPDGMSGPQGITFDSAGNLWVADPPASNRVTEFLPPFSNNEAPTLAIGQKNLLGTSLGCNRTVLDGPTKPVFGPSGDLWVVDGSNARVLEYVPTNYSVMFSETGLPTGTSWSVTFGTTSRPSTTGSIGFSVWNGTYAYAVGSVAGYTATPTGGSSVVNGGPLSYTIRFNATSSSSGSSGFSWSSNWWWILLVLVVLALVLYVLIWRRRRRVLPPSPPAVPPGAT
jgi:hypothetical protein